MTDIDRYITDEAVQAACDAIEPLSWETQDHVLVSTALAAALPHIEPLVRMDEGARGRYWRDRCAALAEIVARVRALHMADQWGTCDGDHGDDRPIYPCPTIRALDGAA